MNEEDKLTESQSRDVWLAFEKLYTASPENSPEKFALQLLSAYRAIYSQADGTNQRPRK